MTTLIRAYLIFYTVSTILVSLSLSSSAKIGNFEAPLAYFLYILTIFSISSLNSLSYV